MTIPPGDVQDAVSYVRETNANTKKKWCILGKGPSSDYFLRVDWDEYNVVTLNHACLLLRPFLAAFIDMEALWDCDEYLLKEDISIVMPWHPHEHMKARRDSLLDRCELGNSLMHALQNSRLYSYNTTHRLKVHQHPALTTVVSRFFSVVAAFNVLVAAGVREVFSLGVDGGNDYGYNFDRKHLLKNGRDSFDDQFIAIKKTCRNTGAKLIPIKVDTDVKPKTAEEMLLQLYSIASGSSVKTARSRIHSIFKDLRQKKEFELCNTILQTLDVTRFSPALLITVVSVAECMRSHVPSWHAFALAAYSAVCQVSSKESADILFKGFGLT